MLNLNFFFKRSHLSNIEQLPEKDNFYKAIKEVEEKIASFKKSIE